MHGHACEHCGYSPPAPRPVTPPLASRPAPLDERHIDIIARRVVEMLAERLAR